MNIASDGRQHAGKAAVVTGAGSGIGKGIARRLASEGARVACLDYNRETAEQTAADIDSQGGPGSVGLQVDVRERPQVRDALGRVRAEFGAIDQLVNAAGRVTMTGFSELTDEQWDEVLDVNLKGYFIMAQEAAESLVSAKGAIVNISTIESEVIVSSSGQCQVHYNASKGGVRMLTKALAAELAEGGVRVNAVAPGPIDTPFTGYDMTSPEIFEFMSQRLLIKRIGQPEDIAAAVSFLLSADASFITGIQLPVDGGWLVR